MRVANSTGQNLPTSEKTSRMLLLTLILLGLTGALLVFISTSLAIGVQPDSINYLIASDTLLSGNSYLKYSDEYVGIHVFQPPLYPTLLAIFRLVSSGLGIELLQLIRFSNAAIFGLTIFSSGYLFSQYIKSKLLVILGTFTVTFSFPLLIVFSYVWSEPLFVLLGVLFLIYLSKFVKEQKTLYLVIMCLLAALASIQRYVGVAFIAAGFVSIILLTHTIPLKTRTLYGVIFGIVAALPLVLWTTRNYQLTGTFTGERPPARNSLFTQLGYTLYWLTNWFSPFQLPSIPAIISMGIFALAIVGITGWLIRRVYQRDGKITIDGLLQTFPGTLTIFTLIYLFFLILGHSSTDLTPINNRYVSPIYPSVMLLVFMGIESLLQRANTYSISSISGRTIIIALVIMWLVYPVTKAVQRVITTAQTGPVEVNIINPTVDLLAAWEHSDLLQWLEANPLQGRIYSNAPAPIYARTEQTAYGIPLSLTDWEQIKQELDIPDRSYPDGLPGGVREWPEIQRNLSSDQDTYLVWFNDVMAYGCEGDFNFRCYNTDFTPLTLDDIFEVEAIVEVADGGVYQLSQKKN